MNTILDTHIVIQSIAQPDNAFVDVLSNPSEQKKKDKFLDRVRVRIYDILRNNNIRPKLFLVREFSNNMKSASIKNKLYMHSHILIFIEKEKYNDKLIDQLAFRDNQYSTRTFKLRNIISKDKQNLTSLESLNTFIQYMLKNINKESILYKDYLFTNCPLQEYIENQINLKLHDL